MNIRLKNLRKALDLTQHEFGARIGSTQNAITGYESGRRSPSKSVINNICKEFNVSEVWLRTGAGEMFIQKPKEPLDTLLAELLAGGSITDGDKVMIKNFLKLSDKERKAVIEFIQQCARDLAASDPAPSPAGDLAERVAALEQENRALQARLNGGGMSREELHAELDRQLDLEKKAGNWSAASQRPGLLPEEGKKETTMVKRVLS